MDLHETTWLFDISRVKQFYRCPRLDLWTRVLGIHPDEDSHDIKFGVAFHEALAALYTTGWDLSDRVHEASTYLAAAVADGLSVEDAALTYAGHFPALANAVNIFTAKAPVDISTSGKTVGRGVLALLKYVLTYSPNEFAPIIRDGIPLTEISGSIPTSSGRLHFRIDFLGITRDGLLFVIEHKTSAFSENWGSFWRLDPQPIAYAHAVETIVGSCAGTIINGILFRQTVSAKRYDLGDPFRHIDLQRVIVTTVLSRTMQLLDSVDYVVRTIVMWMKNIRSMVSAERLPAWPRQFETCVNLFRRECPYFYLCGQYPNPLRLEEIPAGFTRKFWDPRKKGE